MTAAIPDGPGRPERLRELGMIESAMALNHATLRGNAQIVLAMELACTADFDLDLLRRACAAVRRRFALLRCAIEDDGTRLHFCRAGAASAAAWHVAPGASLAAFARQVIDAPELDPRRSLWRVVAAPAGAPGIYYLALVLHHAIVDASGAGLVTAALLEALDCLLEGSPPPDVRGDMLPPALDDFLAAAPNVPPTAAPTGAHGPNPGWTPIGGRHTGFQTLELAAPVHAALRHACRVLDVTDNALLTALYVRACVACGIVADPVAVRSAVSLRDVLGAAADPVALGCYIGVNTTLIESGAGSVVELARRYQRELVRSILGTSLRKRTFAVPALRAAMASAERRDAFQPGVGITNIGRVAPAAGLRGIRLRHYLPLARRLSNANGCVLHVHSLDERLALTLVYPEPNFAPSLAGAILADLGDGLTALAQDAAKVAA